MSRRRACDATPRAGFADELLARLERAAARRTTLRRAATGATATASVAVLFATRRRGR